MNDFRDALAIISGTRGLTVEKYEENIDGTFTIELRKLRPHEHMSRDFIRARLRQFIASHDDEVIAMVDELYHRAVR